MKSAENVVGLLAFVGCAMLGVALCIVVSLAITMCIMLYLEVQLGP